MMERTKMIAITHFGSLRTKRYIENILFSRNIFDLLNYTIKQSSNNHYLFVNEKKLFGKYDQFNFRLEQYFEDYFLFFLVQQGQIRNRSYVIKLKQSNNYCSIRKNRKKTYFFQRYWIKIGEIPANNHYSLIKTVLSKLNFIIIGQRSKIVDFLTIFALKQLINFGQNYAFNNKFPYLFYKITRCFERLDLQMKFVFFHFHILTSANQINTFHNILEKLAQYDVLEIKSITTILITPKTDFLPFSWGFFTDMPKKQVYYFKRPNFYEVDNSLFDIIDEKQQEKVMQPTIYHKSSIVFINNNKTASLIRPLQSAQQYSQSFVLTLAHFLNEIDGILPLLTPHLKRCKITINETHSNDEVKSKKNLFEIWCEYVFSLLGENKVICQQKIIFLYDVVPDTVFKVIEKMDQFKIESMDVAAQNKAAVLGKIKLSINGNKKNNHGLRKIGLINFSVSTNNADKLKPRIYFEGLVSGIFHNHGDHWVSYKILRGQIPTVQKLLQLDTIILSGSSHCVLTMPAQISIFLENLQKAINIKTTLKVLGICFGHQLLSYSQGISVTQKPLNKGSININFSFEGKEQLPYLKPILDSQYRFLRLFKYHNDHVNSIPSAFDSIGTSLSCENEAFISKDKRILSLQCHPQYSDHFISKYDERVSNYASTPSAQFQLILNDQFHKKSIRIMRSAIRSFINWVPYN